MASKSPPDLGALLEQLTASLTATTSALDPTHDSKSYLPPPNALSLLNLKSELLLSYIHNLSFLLLLKLRGTSLKEGEGRKCVEKLAELRVLLEKGVKPIEGRLRYQIEKVVAAASEEERRVSGEAAKKDEESEEDSDEESGSDYEESGMKKVGKMKAAPSISTQDLAFKPNPGAMVAPKDARRDESDDEKAADGIYRPPRIQAVSMPLPETAPQKKERLQKSHTLDEFVASELSGAPMSMPSIGSTISSYGRSVQTAREKEKEQERREYEESNFVRLPKISKKEARKTKKPTQGFGGEDWREFAGDMDRISKGVERGSKSTALDRSRKRKGEMREGDMGGRFEARKAMMGGGKRRRKG